MSDEVAEQVASIELERRSVEDLRQHPRNPRTHPEPGSSLWRILERSIRHAYFEPLVWNRRNGYLISGHLRLKVLIDLGYTQVDVSVVDVDEETHLAMMIAANRVIGEWEKEALQELAADIDQAGLDAALALYDQASLLSLVNCPPTSEDDGEVEELVTKADHLLEKWKVEQGDLFQIGEHRLLCGPCEKQESWSRLLGESQADMIWTDPPYNVAYDPADRQRARGKAAASNPILNDDLPEDEYGEVLEVWLAAGASRLKRGGAIYVAHADAYTGEVRRAATAAGIHVAQCLVWVKQAFTLTRQDYQWQHEPVLYGWKEGAGHYWQGGFSHSTVIDDEEDLKGLSKAELITLVNHYRNGGDTSVVREPRPMKSELHPTMKPIRLVARHIWNSSRRGDTVLELFGGSGTTMVAAEQLGRKCVATELDPKFVAVILERMSWLGLDVTLEAGA